MRGLFLRCSLLPPQCTCCLFGDFLMLRVLRESGGCAVAVSDEELMTCVPEMASATGIFPAPEGAANLAGLRKLVKRGLVSEDERVVLFNTGSGLKYIDVMDS